MSDEIRGWLYGWLGKRKLGTPAYNTMPMATRGGKPRFKCELRVPGQPHVGLGISANKKDAATNAARDFAQFLIRQKLLDPAELPALTSTTNLDASGWGTGADGTLEGPGSLVKKSEDLMKASNGENRYPEMDTPFVPPPKVKTEHERYIEQKAEEIAQVPLIISLLLQHLLLEMAVSSSLL
ncbi:unnamed protein product [Gongylonema pulchrum]|uniref:DRBM domain-containing protein n=1 Tax=Gongylonema pulchrum TaxID=637853 RepID=A0A183EDL7_9BILA|nr:unnamed protein product [Gongylonema pulchrum]